MGFDQVHWAQAGLNMVMQDWKTEIITSQDAAVEQSICDRIVSFFTDAGFPTPNDAVGITQMDLQEGAAGVKCQCSRS